jgi:predicted lactoylglutathione lyase
MRKRITESDINRIVSKVVNENEYDREMIHGISYNKTTELVDDVIMRIKEHGDDYIRELNKLNFNYPTQKYKRVERPRRDNFELPKGVRVQSSVFGDE